MSDAATLQRELLEAVRDRNFDRLHDLYHPQFVHMSADGVEHKGADARVAACKIHAAAFPDLSFEIRNQFAASADVSITEFTARGTHKEELQGIPATGRAVEVVVCNVIEARDGKVYRQRAYYDGPSLMQQLGVIDAGVAGP